MAARGGWVGYAAKKGITALLVLSFLSHAGIIADSPPAIATLKKLTEPVWVGT